MQVVRQVCTRVCGDITFSGHAQEVHCAECVHYLLGCEVLPATVHLLFQVLVYQQSQEACQEVCLDVALGFDKKKTLEGLQIKKSKNIVSNYRGKDTKIITVESRIFIKFA